MGKLDELRRATGSNVAESMGKGVARSPMTHGASVSGQADRWTGVERLAGAQRIAVDRIIRDPSQPREIFPAAELQELADSIRARGVLQPIRVRWDEGQSMYVVIAGERRLRASALAGLAEVPCVVHDGAISESDLLLDQLAENLVRLDLQPIEQAKAFRRLMDANGWSARRLAEELHIDHDKVNRSIRLLNLPEDIQEAVADGAIAPTSAFEITKIEDPEIQAEVASLAVAGNLTRSEVAETVRAHTPRSSAKNGKGRASKPKLKTSVILRTALGSKITIENRKGLDDQAIHAALTDAINQIAARLAGHSEAA